MRIADLVTDRYYLDSGQITLFGTGPSWWYPERAAAFLKREELPGNVFHDYGLGGYLTWRIGPEYPDFVDGRYIPFGNDLFSEQRLLASLGPDTAEWQRAADRWQINTAIFSVARYAGLGSFALPGFLCEQNMEARISRRCGHHFRSQSGGKRRADWEAGNAAARIAPIAAPDVASGELLSHQSGTIHAIS